MAHYAFLDENNTVTEVIVGKDETELLDGLTPEEWYGNFRGQRCVRTSYNHNIRKQYAQIGGTYNEEADVFISVKPFESWILDENYDWKAPTEKPEEGFWVWDEDSVSWVSVPAPPFPSE
jgi:hypothetical protein